MLIRGIGIIEGVFKELNPNINLVQVLANKLEKETVNNIISEKNIKKIGKTLVSSTNGLLNLPNNLSNLISAVSNGEVKFKVEFSNSTAHIDKLEKLLHELIVGFLDGVLIIGLCITQDDILRYILLFFIIVLSLWLFYVMLRDKFHDGY
jgi:ubiquinone biosynthesis protein